MQKFKATEKTTGQKMEVVLVGAIDEDAALPAIQFSDIAQVVFDFGQVTAINSCGIRDWIKWISHILSSTQLIYSKCPKIIVDQINTVDGFLPANARVESFYVPYYCTSCDQAEVKLFKTLEVPPKSSSQIPQTIRCPKCSKECEIDIIEAKYFKFLSRG